MDLTKLRTLICVAELGSLSKAADRMHIAQPALSRHIRLLEEELGTRLFDRHGRGMVITETGKEVMRRASRIIDELNDIRSSIADSRSTLTGRLVVGMPPTVSEILSVPLVTTLRATHPRLEIRFFTAFSGYLLDWLQRGEIDVAVLYDPQVTRSVRSHPLLLESLVLVGPPGRLSQAQAVPFADLAAETLLLPNARHGLRVVVERAASEAGVTLRVDIETDSLHTLKDLVGNGFGLTILPLAPIHNDVESGRLSVAPLVEPGPMRRLMLSFSSDRPITRAARFAADAISDQVAAMVQQGVWTGHLMETDRR